MLRRWVVGCPVHWPKRSLTSDAAPELLLHFLPGALFDWVRAAAQGQQCNRERNRKGPHLLILWSADFIARRLNSSGRLKCNVIVILSEAKNL